MKKTILFFQFIVILLLAVNCKNNGSQSDEETQNIFVPDSLWTPKGNAKLDSMFQLAAVSPQDTILASLYIDIGYQYLLLYSDYEQVKEYYLKSKALSEKLNWNSGRIKFAKYFYSIIFHEGLEDSAIFILQEGIRIATIENQEANIAYLSLRIGSCNISKTWYETALQYLHKSLSIYEKLKDNENIALVYGNITGLYNRMGMYNEMLLYSGKALELLQDTPDDMARVNALINRNLALQVLNELDEAEKCLLESLRICEVNNNEWSLWTIYSNLAGVELKRFDLEKAAMYNAKSLEFSLKFGFKEGNYFSHIKNADIEMYRGNFKKAEEYANEALKIAIGNANSFRQLGCYRKLSRISIAKHDFKKGLLYSAKVDSIENIQKMEKTISYAKEMEAKYETEKKELEIERQKQIIARQQMQRWFWVAGIAVSILVLVLLWYMLRLRNRRNKALTQQNETLAEMNSTKNKFFNIISHDLKTPTVTQRNALQRLVENGRTWDAETLSEYYEELLKSADGQVALVFNLLNWAQIQTGRINYAPDTFALSNLISEMTLVKKMAEVKGITLNLQIPQDEFITCDRNILSTVLRNLLSNAIKFTHEGGQVTLDIAQCKDAINRLSTDATYTISVTDTGIGMNKEQTETLFNLINPTSRKGTSGEQSSGLGLIICKEFLEKLGSELQVESEEGKGSRFWFEVGGV